MSAIPELVQLAFAAALLEANEERQCLSREGGGNTRQRQCLSREGGGNTRQRQCLRREGGGNTRQRQCLSREGSGNTRQRQCLTSLRSRLRVASSSLSSPSIRLAAAVTSCAFPVGSRCVGSRDQLELPWGRCCSRGCECMLPNPLGTARAGDYAASARGSAPLAVSCSTGHGVRQSTVDLLKRYIEQCSVA